MSDQSMTICGTLVKDVEIRYGASGAPIANFSIASNRRWQQQGEWKDEACFFDCNAFGSLAENLAASCIKGTRVILTGYLSQRTFQTQEGVKRTVYEFKVDEAGPALKWATCLVVRNPRREREG